MKFNGYKLVGLFCTGLSMVNQASATQTQIKGMTGISLKNSTPVVYYAVKTAGIYAEPTRQVVNKVANDW